jgi:hypothetical protein
MLERLNDARFAAKTSLLTILGGCALTWAGMAIGGFGPCGPSSPFGLILPAVGILLLLAGLLLALWSSLRGGIRTFFHLREKIRSRYSQ